jgi:uncharacterized membrane protein YfcA
VIAAGVHGVPRLLIAGAAAVIAGAVNAIAGGGTLLTFPTLIALGVNPVVANATNALALFPGSLAGAVGFRRELRRTRHWLRLLLPPSVVGGAAGAVLLLHTSTHLFRTISPFLVLLAAVLLALQDAFGARIVHLSGHASTRWRVGAVCFQLLVGLYGGFFGAGIGILMLAALGALGVGDIHEMNGIKNVLATCINLVAAVYFAASGAIVWSVALVMAVGAVAGAFAGASLSRRFPATVVVRAVVILGVGVAIGLFVTR